MIWLVGQHFWCKKRRKGGGGCQRFAELFQERENISKSRFERTPESKSWLDIHLFNFWLENRQERKQNWHSKHSRELADKEQVNFILLIGRLYNRFARKIVRNIYRGNTLYEIIIAFQHYLCKNERYETLMVDTLFKGARKCKKKKNNNNCKI